MITIDINKRLHGVKGKMQLNIDLHIKEGEFIALTGDSGAGKSTFLRILAGLESAKGVIKIGDKIWQDENISLPPQKREIGFVFQDYALFPNMTVEENLLFVSKDRELAKKLLDITEISTLKDRFPNTLSGGQKQRVSLCRAFMKPPKLLLMDEPLSALDPTIRAKLQKKIIELHKEFSTTTIMVTHDPSEIYKMANRVILLKLGKIINIGQPKEILLNNIDIKPLNGEIIEIIRKDKLSTAILSLGERLIEVELTQKESKELRVGQYIEITTKYLISKI